MNIDSILRTSISEAFKELFDHEIQAVDIKLEPTNKEFEGSHTFIVFPYLKITKKGELNFPHKSL